MSANIRVVKRGKRNKRPLTSPETVVHDTVSTAISSKVTQHYSRQHFDLFGLPTEIICNILQELGLPPPKKALLSPAAGAVTPDSNDTNTPINYPQTSGAPPIQSVQNNQAPQITGNSGVRISADASECYYKFDNMKNLHACYAVCSTSKFLHDCYMNAVGEPCQRVELCIRPKDYLQDGQINSASRDEMMQLLSKKVSRLGHYGQKLIVSLYVVAPYFEGSTLAAEVGRDQRKINMFIQGHRASRKLDSRLMSAAKAEVERLIDQGEAVMRLLFECLHKLFSKNRIETLKISSGSLPAKCFLDAVRGYLLSNRNHLQKFCFKEDELLNRKIWQAKYSRDKHPYIRRIMNIYHVSGVGRVKNYPINPPTHHFEFRNLENAFQHFVSAQSELEGHEINSSFR